MKKKITVSAIILALGVGATFAAEETNELIELRKKVRLQEQQLKGINKRIDELSEAPAVEEKSSWTDKIKVKGDFRYRYEYQSKEGNTSKNRQRIRARLGAYADVNDFTTAGIRLATGNDANSGNQTIGGDFDAKSIYLDLAYLTIAPADAKYGSATFGKMKYPWKNTTDLIWDGDVNPEGIAYAFSGKADKTSLIASAGYFKVEDNSTNPDLDLVTGQLGLTQPLNDTLKATFGGSYYFYRNAEQLGQPVDYAIAELFAELGIKTGSLPLKLYANAVNNTEISSQNNGFAFGLKVGDAKKGKWEAKLGYRDLDQYAAVDMFADSDFAGGGTGIKGGRLKAKYNIGKNFQLGATAIAGRDKVAKQDVNTVQLDLIVKF